MSFLACVHSTVTHCLCWFYGLFLDEGVVNRIAVWILLLKDRRWTWVNQFALSFSSAACSRIESVGISGANFYRHNALPVYLSSKQQCQSTEGNILRCHSGAVSFCVCLLHQIIIIFILIVYYITVVAWNFRHYILFMLGTPYAVVIKSRRVAESSTTYKVQWEMISSGGLPIKQYEFKYRRVSILELIKHEYKLHKSTVAFSLYCHACSGKRGLLLQT